MRLTRKQVEEFYERRVLIARSMLTDAVLQPVIDELSAFIDRRADALQADEPFERRYGLLFGQCREMAKGMYIMQQPGKGLFAFLRNENLLDAAEVLVGAEITCNPIQHIRAKPPAVYEDEISGFHVASWHQDADVMMPEAEQADIVTCWLPLGDATFICRGIARCGQRGYLRHQREGNIAVAPELMPDVEPEYLECERGDVVLMDKFTPHKSTPNRPDRCHGSLHLRYQTTGQHTGPSLLSQQLPTLYVQVSTCESTASSMTVTRKHAAVASGLWLGFSAAPSSW